MADEKPKKVEIDSVPKGSTDVWPVLRKEAREIADEVAAGKHDGILSELAEIEAGHGKRDVVIDACRRRLPPAKPAPAKA